MGEQRDAAVRFLSGHGIQQEIAKLAQDSFGLHGRGAVRITAPMAAPRSSLETTDMLYQTLTVLRPLFTETTAENRETAEVVIRMLETYDPNTHAVVLLSFEEGPNPISLKMRLDPPYVVDTDV
jgi:hypothetical protein